MTATATATLGNGDCNGDCDGDFDGNANRFAQRNRDRDRYGHSDGDCDCNGDEYHHSATATATDTATATNTATPTATATTTATATATLTATPTATATPTSSTTLTSNPNPSLFGQSVTFTATVQDSNANAITCGTVTFNDGVTPIATGVPLGSPSSDQAAYTTSTLTVGQHSITAIYVPGACGFVTSTSSVLSQNVYRAAVGIAIWDSVR